MAPTTTSDLENSHVLPALMRKFDEAKQDGRQEVEVWGTGSAMREFMHVDDLADACCFLMESYSADDPINVGTGEDVSVSDLAHILRDVVHPDAVLRFDTSRPDGTPRKVLDVSRINNLGWRASVTLREGIERTYDWYSKNRDSLRGALPQGS